MKRESARTEADAQRPVAINAGAPISAEHSKQLQSLLERHPSLFFSHFSYHIEGQAERAILFLGTLCALLGRSFRAPDVLFTRFAWHQNNRLPVVHWLIRPTRLGDVSLDQFITKMVSEAYGTSMDHPDPGSNSGERNALLSTIEGAGVLRRFPERKPTALTAATMADRPHNAHVRKIYDCALVEKRLDEQTQADKDSQRHELVNCYKRMLDSGGERVDRASPPVPNIRDLAIQFPNFADVVDLLSGAAALSSLSQSGFRFPPLLLLGPPGIGKTHFASELSRAAGLDHGVIHMETTSAGWIISGMHRGWAGASVGKVADLLVNAKCANPILVVDEIDKATSREYDALAPLYGLLEEKTAAAFEDECLNIPLDASGINWILTANNLASVPEPIVSRMTVFNVLPPTAEQLRVIVASIYSDLRGSHAWGAHFEEELCEDVIDVLSEASPRQVRTWLRRALGLVAEAGRSAIQVNDVRATRVIESAPKRAIGFTTSVEALAQRRSDG